MSGGPRGTLALLDLKAVERDLHQTWPEREGLRVMYDHAMALLAHARALRDIVELGRITLTDNGSFPGKSFDWYRAQAMYLGRAAAVLAAAQDGPA